MGGRSQELGVPIEDEINSTAQIRRTGKCCRSLILCVGGGLQQNSACPEVFRRQDIADPISHPPAAPKVDTELLRRLTIQEHAWLATVTRAGELGQVRTEVVRIEV